MRAHSSHWSINRNAQDCPYSSFCIVFTTLFSASFGAIGIDWATGRNLQQVKVESKHASWCRKMCGKKETRRSEKVAHTWYHWAPNALTVGASLIHSSMLWTFIADTARQFEHSVLIPGTTSPCHSLNEVIMLLGFLNHSSPTWHPGCVLPKPIFLIQKCPLYFLGIVIIVYYLQ